MAFRKLPISSILLLLALSTATSTTRQITPDLFSCTSSNRVDRTICQLVLTRLNTELSSSGITISKNSLLFTYNDDTDRKIPTGHSCTRRAKLQSQSFSANFLTKSALNLTGDSLIEPLALQLHLPVTFSGRLNIVQRFGIRVFGSCSTTGSDRFSFLGSLSTKAKLLVGLHLNPSLGLIESGDYALVIQPRVAVISSLDDTDIKFRVSGASPIAAVYTAVTGLTSTVLKSVTKLLTGGSAAAEFDNVFQNDILYPLVLGVGSLPRPVEEALFERFLKVGEKAVTAAGSKFGDELEETLRKEVSRALKLDKDGKRTIILKRDAVYLLTLGGKNFNVFVEPPQDPSTECLRNARVGCISSRGSLLKGCSQKFARCSQLGQEYRQQYTIQGLRRSKSKIEAAIEARRPTRPRTVRATPRPRYFDIDECLEKVENLCSDCYYCSDCNAMREECHGL